MGPRTVVFAAVAVLIAGASGLAQRPPRPYPPAVERWEQMSPEERQRRLAQLPPERREKIERQIERYEKLTPEERDRLARRYENFRKLPPAQQERVRRAFRQLQALPQERRVPVRRELVRLRNLTEEDRLLRMESPQFRNRFRPEERRLLRDLAEVPMPQE